MAAAETASRVFSRQRERSRWKLSPELDAVTELGGPLHSKLSVRRPISKKKRGDARRTPSVILTLNFIIGGGKVQW
jgi:hypothetical protein